MPKFNGLILKNDSFKRHKLLSASPSYTAPVIIDERSKLLPASNQGVTSQCVSYSIAGKIEYDRWKNLYLPEQILPAPIHTRAKQIDGYPNEEGTSLEAGLQAAQDLGLLPLVNQNSIRTVTTEIEVKQALHKYGVVLGTFMATEGWIQPAPDGWMQPDKQALGLHCVLLCGYNWFDEKKYWSIQNSWGDIGWHGFVRMSPEQFIKEFQGGLVWDYQ